ncbi:MAG: hypothetical protein ACRD3E_02395 [Terriglobales bacterium]
MRIKVQLARLSAACMLLLCAAACFAQQDPAGTPQANPGRPTVSTPATLTPIGYVQFETGVLGAWDSPEFKSQASVNEVVKFSVSKRVELLAGFGPLVHTLGGVPTNGTGDLLLGMQGVVHQGEGARPTIAVGYFRQMHDGGTPSLDIGSFRNSALLLLSADIKGFHYDTNYLFNEVLNGEVRRLQVGQTLSVSHGLPGKFGVSAEIWHFTQPFLRGRAAGILSALNYNARPNLVLDTGFDRGLTATSTSWEAFAGFTYLLPHRIRWR